MKSLQLILFCLLAHVSARAQGVSIDRLMKLKPVAIATQRTDPYPGTVYLAMPFSEAVFKDTSGLRLVGHPSRIYAINLVYTRYRESDSFNQPKLNYYRFQELKKVLPGAFKTDSIEWKVLEQREAKTREEAAKCFHGFIILLKNEVPRHLIEKELRVMNSVLNTYRESKVWIPEKIEWKVKKTKIETGRYLPRSYEKQRQGIRYSSSFLGMREKEYRIRRDSTIRKKTGGYYERKGSFDSTMFRNLNEYNLLTRRTWSKKMSVVADVTGSMTPYSTQILLWLKFRPEVLEQGRFVFFNDGDAKPDMLKRTGSTGGIHFAPYRDFDSVKTTMAETMLAGTGGDIPENNIEAVLETLKRWPDTDTVLLIADNDAAVKDISLLPRVNKPVSVMVCGGGEKINRDYIDIARATGGRLFVMNTEIDNLKKLQNGTELSLGGKKYEYRKGELVRKRN